MLTQYIPILVFLVVAVGFALLLVFVARALGPKRDTPEKSLPYECGQDPASSPRGRFSVRFYRIAILFLVFDIEAAFFYPWAILFREMSCKGGKISAKGICEIGATPFSLLVMVVFLSIMVLALLYVWRKKALEWQ